MAVLETVRQGIGGVVEKDDRPVAAINASKSAGRLSSKVLADLYGQGSRAVIDNAFAHDIEESIRVPRSVARLVGAFYVIEIVHMRD